MKLRAQVITSLQRFSRERAPTVYSCSTHFLPDANDVQHAGVAKLCDDQLIIIVFRRLNRVWLETSHVPGQRHCCACNMMNICATIGVLLQVLLLYQKIKMKTNCHCLTTSFWNGSATLFLWGHGQVQSWHTKLPDIGCELLFYKTIFSSVHW